MTMITTKLAPSKSLVIGINLAFLSSFLLIYAALLLRPSNSFYLQGKGRGIETKAALGNTRSNRTRRERPSFLGEVRKGTKIGVVNMEDEDLDEWGGKIIPVPFERVSAYFEWKHLFPEWIDEEEEMDGASCPEIPLPDFDALEALDIVVAKLPCRYPEVGWAREVFRLQVHLVATKLAVSKGRRGGEKRSKVVLLSKCSPMPEFFRCDDLVANEGEWWFYWPDSSRLEHKLSLPVGSCQLTFPLWRQGVDKTFDVSKIRRKHERRTDMKREAYVTLLHSSESYVCGAIALARSLIKTGTKRDLIMLLDASISPATRLTLGSAGWKTRLIERIRNPMAEKNTYNEYNYSKFRIWQLTDYDKLVFIDSDVLILKNLDVLFSFPQVSAAGNDGSIFNSGVMVIEPSNCTFGALMKLRGEVRSYNGGDQGFLNEVFVWWHRLPRRVNFLKNFWSNSTVERGLKNQLFGSEPPELYGIHYIGLKPWVCYRDYDCNFDLWEKRVYASDVAHSRWWRFYDDMPSELLGYCALSPARRVELEWDREKARKGGLPGEYWKVNITDPRRLG